MPAARSPPAEIHPRNIKMAHARRTLPLLRRGTQFAAAAPQPPPPQLRRLATAPPTQEPFADLDPKDDTPPHLARPIGLLHPPRAGQNTGVDTRTWTQRREDFGDWDKHLAKRADLLVPPLPLFPSSPLTQTNSPRRTRQFSKSYFADFSGISARHKGKSFLSPRSLFKADKALFFPNLVGRTLADRSRQDTTTVLEGRVSVVAVFSTAWAESQCATFLAALPPVDDDDDALQRVDINVELNPIKAALVKLFIPRIRKRLPEPQHARYFIVQKGFAEDTMRHMALLNGRVGYVYLLDWDCRIRWAGSGNAEEGEKAALMRGVVRLAQEWKLMEAKRPVQEKKEEKLIDDDDDF